MASKRGAGQTGAKVRSGVAAKGVRRGQPSLAVRKACFLEVLRQTANVARAAREAGLSSSTVYAHRARFAGFARDWDAAMAEALDELECQLIERARNGVEKPVYYRGEVVGSVRSYSDALAMFLLRAKRPEVYDRIGGTAPVAPAITQIEAKAEVVRRIERLCAPELPEGEAGGEDEDAA